MASGDGPRPWSPFRRRVSSGGRAGEKHETAASASPSPNPTETRGFGGDPGTRPVGDGVAAPLNHRSLERSCAMTTLADAREFLVEPASPPTGRPTRRSERTVSRQRSPVRWGGSPVPTRRITPSSAPSAAPHPLSVNPTVNWSSPTEPATKTTNNQRSASSDTPTGPPRPSRASRPDTNPRRPPRPPRPLAPGRPTLLTTTRRRSPPHRRARRRPPLQRKP
jgi:hypothetical protein